jgi:hypothetical protein
MKIYKVTLITLLLFPHLALAQRLPDAPPNRARIITEQTESQTPVEAAEQKVDRAVWYGLGAILLIVVAILGSWTLLRDKSIKK